MKEEVVIINGTTKAVYVNEKDADKGFTKWVLHKWDTTEILKEPQ